MENMILRSSHLRYDLWSHMVLYQSTLDLRLLSFSNFSLPGVVVFETSYIVKSHEMRMCRLQGRRL